jgi:phosphatidate cytidylyltransferase
MVFSGIYIFVLFFFSGRDLANVFPLLAILFGLTAVFTPYFMSKEKPLLNSATTLFGIFYITIPLGCILTLLYFFPPGAFQDGRWWLVYLLAVTFSTNSSALFVGKTFGKTKLAPAISPNKTWEGAIGGFLAAIAVSVLFSLFARNGLIPISLTFAESIFLGTGTSLFAQFGDLAESLLKRDADVKDSSNIPGLGGILDVVDSLVFTAPFIYLYIKFASSWN